MKKLIFIFTLFIFAGNTSASITLFIKKCFGISLRSPAPQISSLKRLSPEELNNFKITDEVIANSEKIDSGEGTHFVYQLESGSKVFIKRNALQSDGLNVHNTALNEISAYKLDQLADGGLVPLTAKKNYDGRVYSVSEYREHATKINIKMPSGGIIKSTKTISEEIYHIPTKIALFDFFIANLDRNPTNLLIITEQFGRDPKNVVLPYQKGKEVFDPSKAEFVAIDHGRSYNSYYKNDNKWNDSYQAFRKKRSNLKGYTVYKLVEENMDYVKKLIDIPENKLREVLSHLEEGELDALLKRQGQLRHYYTIILNN